MLLILTSLTWLNVQDNAFGPGPLRAFVDLLPSLPALQYYNTNNTGLSPEGGRIYANALQGKLIADLPPEDGGLAIAEADAKQVKLTTFIAGRSRIETGGIMFLAESFERMGSLVELRIPQNGIKGEGTICSFLFFFTTPHSLNVIFVFRPQNSDISTPALSHFMF